MAGSYIADTKGLDWIHWTNVIVSATTLAFCFFLQPETLFDRQKACSRSQTHGEDDVNEKNTSTTLVEEAGPTSLKPYNFVRSLKIGIYRPDIVKQFIAPFLTLRFPGVWLVMLWFGGLVGGIVSVSTIGPQLVAFPPYQWGRNAGLINLGGVVGAILGALYTYSTADFILKRQAKSEKHGFSEPESRLPTVLPSLFLATTSLWVCGFCAQNPSAKA
jgi:hypothetical protein